MENIKTNKTASNAGMLVAIFGVFFLAADIGAINPALADIQLDYPQISAAGMSYITTIASIGQLIAGLIFAAIGGRKIGYKPLLIIALLVFAVFGALPSTFVSSVPFAALLITRLFFGLGIGALFPIANACITRMYREDENRRSSMLGLGNAFFNAGACVAAPIGGILCATRWQNTFLFYALGFLVLILVIVFFKEPSKELVEEERSGKVKIGKIAAVFLVLFFVVMIFQQPIWTGLAIVVTEAGLGGSVGIGILMMVMSIVMVIGSLAFGPLYRIFKGQLLTAALICEIVGFALIYLGAAPGNGVGWMVWIGGIFVAIGVFMYTASMPMILSIVVAPAALAAAMGLNTFAMNLGAFASSPYFQLVTAAGAQTRTVYLVSALALLIVAIVVCVVAKKSAALNAGKETISQATKEKQ